MRAVHQSPKYMNPNTSTSPVLQQASLPFMVSSLETSLPALHCNDGSRLTQVEIIWIQAGSGSLTADFNTMTFSGNVVFCLAPGLCRTLAPHSRLTGYYLSLSRDFLKLSEGQADLSILSAQHALGNKVLTLRPDVGLAIEMQDVIEKMLREYSNYFMLRAEILKSLVRILGIYLTRNTPQDLAAAVNSRDVDMVRKFMALVERHYATKKKVSEYADELCVTPNYLNQRVKRVSGFPASYHIQQQIVLEAKRQAACSGMRMKEIADALGFQDHAHFSKFFKTYSGVSFSSYKSALSA
jgi:AraC family transcriptional regulator, transcriptional activator of pobA